MYILYAISYEHTWAYRVRTGVLRHAPQFFFIFYFFSISLCKINCSFHLSLTSEGTDGAIFDFLVKLCDELGGLVTKVDMLHLLGCPLP